MADAKSDTDPATERFQALLEVEKPPTGGMSTESLVAEVAPLLPLLSELPPEMRAGGDFESFEFRECFTVLTLLGRRLALLDLTPTSAIGVTRLALRSIDPAGEAGGDEFAQRAVAAAIEGFVLGREERIDQVSMARAASSLKPLRINASTFGLIISGVHEPAVLSDCVDALGRAMLDADVELAIVDLSQLGEPNPERAIAVFAADEIARMLGGRCIFSGVEARWEAAAADARIPLEALETTSGLAEAIDLARNLADRDAEERNPGWRSLLRRLLP